MNPSEQANEEDKCALQREIVDLCKQHEAAIKERDGLRAALDESSKLLCFLHGAFGDQLKPKDVVRLKAAHASSMTALFPSKSEKGDAQ